MVTFIILYGAELEKIFMQVKNWRYPFSNRYMECNRNIIYPTYEACCVDVFRFDGIWVRTKVKIPKIKTCFELSLLLPLLRTNLPTWASLAELPIGIVFGSTW